MTSIFDVDAAKLIDEAANELKNIKELAPPEWAAFVKTGSHKERAPVREDWWYVRAASVLRTIHKLGPVGVSKLRTKYGGKKRRGVKPNKFQRASGNILRKALQQLEKAGLAKQAKKGVHKGRIITPKGVSLLAKAAKKVGGAVKKPAPKPVEAKKEEIRE